MKNKKNVVGMLTLIPSVLLVACSNQDTETLESVNQSVDSSILISESSSESQMADESESMESMQHDDSGEIPVGLEEAEKPKYEVGEQVTLLTDHMSGMENATATIVGAFDTTAYEVTYQPINGDELEKNHKWVIKEEIPEAKSQEKPLESGTEVTLEAKHMIGMEGAVATIDSFEEDTTVYMVDYQPTDGGETVKNHKWVTEEELLQK